MYQYMIVINGAKSEIQDETALDRWDSAAWQIEERGYIGKLRRRLVTDADIMDSLTDRTGWMVIHSKAISPWETIAQIG